MFLIPIHILATTLMVIFEENFLSQITLKVVKIADIKFIFNMLSNICHNLMIYILSPCFLPTVQLQLQHPLLVYQTELETCQRCQLGEKSAERGATDLDLGKLLFTYTVGAHAWTNGHQTPEMTSLLFSQPPTRGNLAHPLEEERSGHYGRSLSKPIHYLISGGGVREGRGGVGVGVGKKIMGVLSSQLSRALA